MTKYLNSHPTISVSDFIKKGYTLYNKNQCKFKIEKHTFKNLYYNWKKNSLALTKFSALENVKANNDE